jgi:hypothetical protein
MAQDFGNGVSRTISVSARQFEVVVWQSGKPPLDSELNLIGQASWERAANAIRSQMHSGFLLDPFQADQDYVTNELWSNYFKLGRMGTDAEAPIMWANVNGWMVPVTGTDVVDGDVSNRINLYLPPTSDARIDFIFLEVWLAQVAPNPSAVNKPSDSTLYKYGNAEFGGTNLSDDLEDPNIGFETTERVQLQYRLRVFGTGSGLGDSVDLSTFPDGLDDPNVIGQGAATAPQLGYTFTNMLDELGDPSLWRSGDGDPTNDLGTVDGYVYAIPVCGVFRRNSASFVARTNAGNANQNGALERNPNTSPITDPVECTRTFGTITLVAAIDEDPLAAGGSVQVTSLAGSGFDNVDLNWDEVFLKIDDEIIYISGVSTATTPGTITIRPTIGRGRNGTQAAPHDAGAAVEFYCFRSDGKFADEIHFEDILDLRKGVSAGEWDYQALLAHNLGKLFENSLKTSYKQSGISDTEGPIVLEVDTLYSNGAFPVPNQTEALDGPDGIRTVFSDSVVVESGVSLILNPGSSGPAVVSDYTASAGSWGFAPAFIPDGFQPGAGFTNQSIINLYIGGATGNGGARATVRDSAANKVARFLTPREYWISRDEIFMDEGVGVSGNQYPFMFRFLREAWGEPAAGGEVVINHPGPMFPLPEHNFELPFIVLGGVVNSTLSSSSAAVVLGVSVPSGLDVIRVAGLDFNTVGTWFANGDLEGLGTDNIAQLLLYGKRNLFDMLTAGGLDRSGNSSELYLVLSGDNSNANNCGVFRVVGAGTAGYTTESGVAATDLVVERVGVAAGALTANTGLDMSVRSQYTHTDDGDATTPAVVVVLTDLTSTDPSSPWNGLVTGGDTQAILDTALIYGASRGGTARVANELLTLGLVGTSAELVRESPTAIDPTFYPLAGVPDGEFYFPLNHIQTWNRLPSLGLSAPRAPAYGEGSSLGEYLREAEVFVDAGSKTVMVRPFQLSAFSTNRYQVSAGRFFPPNYTVGPFLGAVDGGLIFQASGDYGYAVPWEHMPRFGRQDIPFRQTTGTTGPVYYGINHLFGDSQTVADDVFRVVGGPDSVGGVLSIFFQTGTTSGRDYGEYYTLAATAEGYQARIYEDVNVISSDMPRGLKGIQLPPFLGIVRLYGVYDLREFTGDGAWNTDRVTLSGAIGRPKNLLREDVDKQTLFIVPGGAEDVTGDADDHTYVIPSTMIDVRRSGQYIAGETFDDIEFVVECVVFGFGRGFINKNNYVMMRKNLPTGGTGIGVTPALAEDVACILPLPLPFNEQLYTVYDRTVYQGDPYMTRDGATRTVSDYEHRYGQIPASGSTELSIPIQQYDSTNDYVQVPTKVNARPLEILASMDFYTTLGTGKVGGRIYPGTPLDPGHISNDSQSVTRVAASSADPYWQVDPRTFTQPQGIEAPRAGLVLAVIQNTPTSAGEVITLTRGETTFTLQSNVDFNGGDPLQAAVSLAFAINGSDAARNIMGVHAGVEGDRVRLISLLPGDEGEETTVSLSPKFGAREAQGFNIEAQGQTSRYGLFLTSSPLIGGEDFPMNAKDGEYAQTPIRMTGLTERLPLGILLQDSDFMGEDPIRNGGSILNVNNSGGSVAPGLGNPIQGTQEYGRIEGSGQIAMADGSILTYPAWTLAQPTGTRAFRLFRGGGSAYVLDPTPAGGPVSWSAGGFGDKEEPVLKGAILAGRAFLVRNYEEEAFAASETRSWGDEIQMVILTNGITGHGPLCGHGISLEGQISPTEYGLGLAAADRYRLEGKPQVAGHSKAGADPDVELAPYPSDDESDPNPCP